MSTSIESLFGDVVADEFAFSGCVCSGWCWAEASLEAPKLTLVGVLPSSTGIAGCDWGAVLGRGVTGVEVFMASFL